MKIVEFIENEFCKDFGYCDKKVLYLIISLLISKTVIFIENLGCFAYASLFSVVMIIISGKIFSSQKKVFTILIWSTNKIMFGKDEPGKDMELRYWHWMGIPDYIGISLYAMEVKFFSRKFFRELEWFSRSEPL